MKGRYGIDKRASGRIFFPSGSFFPNRPRLPVFALTWLMSAFRTSFLLHFLVLSLGGSAAFAQQPASPAPSAPAPAAPKGPVDPMPATPWVPEYGGSAHVMRRDNTDIYIMSKPDRPYEVTGRLIADDMAAYTDPMSGQIVLKNVTILEMVDALLAQARHRQTFYHFPYDALLTTDGQVGTFIRWKNRQAPRPATPDTSSAQK